jgi:hypothetical protein
VLRGGIADPAAGAHRQDGVVNHLHSLLPSSIPTIAGVKDGFKLTEPICVKDLPDFNPDFNKENIVAVG